MLCLLKSTDLEESERDGTGHGDIVWPIRRKASLRNGRCLQNSIEQTNVLDNDCRYTADTSLALPTPMLVGRSSCSTCCRGYAAPSCRVSACVSSERKVQEMGAVPLGACHVGRRFFFSCLPKSRKIQEGQSYYSIMPYFVT